MAAMGNAQTVAAQYEKVRDWLELWYERDFKLMKLIQSRSAGDEEVSSRALRLPVQTSPGGSYSAYNPDGGGFPRGDGTSYDVMQVTPVFRTKVVEFTQLVAMATGKSDQAIENMVKREVMESLKGFKNGIDRELQGAGNCVIGRISSTYSGGTTIQLALPPGASQVDINQPIQFYDSTLTTNRNTAAGVATKVLVVNTGQPNIVVDNVPAGVTNTDVIVIDGVSGAQPVGLFGIQYYQNNAQTGFTLLLNRATYPVLMATPSVNASNAAITPQMAELMFNEMELALGEMVPEGKKVAYMNVQQKHAWKNTGLINVQNILNSPQGRTKDYDGTYTGKATFGGYPIETNIHYDQTRIDIIDFSTWGRAMMQDIDFVTNQAGQTYFQLYAQNGSIAASELFAYHVGMQLWNVGLRKGAFTYGLNVPSGYTGTTY